MNKAFKTPSIEKKLIFQAVLKALHEEFPAMRSSTKINRLVFVQRDRIKVLHIDLGD